MVVIFLLIVLLISMIVILSIIYIILSHNKQSYSITMGNNIKCNQNYMNLLSKCDGIICDDHLTLNDILKLSLNYDIKPLGGLKSWSKIICYNNRDQNNMNVNHKIALKFNLNKILDFDDINNTITVEAGITLSILNDFLSQRNKIMYYLPFDAGQTLGGTLASSSHSSNFNFGTSSSGIIEANIINRGNINSNKLDIIGTTLGEYFIYSVKMKIFDMIYVDVVSGNSTFEEFYKISQIQNKFNLVGFYIPSQDIVHYYYLTIVDKNLNINTNINHNTNINSYKKLNEISFYDLLHPNLRNIPNDIRVEIEIGIDQNDLLKSKPIIDRLNRDIIYDVVLIRFTDKDTSYMSMAYNRKTAFISISSTKEKNFYDEFMSFEYSMFKFDGRPHWAKVNSLYPITSKNINQILKLYPKYPEFINLFNNI